MPQPGSRSWSGTFPRKAEANKQPDSGTGEEERVAVRPLGNRCVHVCVEQRIFAEETDWKTPWMERVLPAVERIVAAHPAGTVFTRFQTVASHDEGRGTWRRFYEHWQGVTTRELAPGLLDLVPSLAKYGRPPASSTNAPTRAGSARSSRPRWSVAVPTP